LSEIDSVALKRWAHCFIAAANSMRQIWVKLALAKRADKRAGEVRQIDMEPRRLRTLAILI